MEHRILTPNEVINAINAHPQPFERPTGPSFLGMTIHDILDYDYANDTEWNDDKQGNEEVTK